MRLEGQVAIITGAAGAFGSAIAQRFAQEGADLALADLNESGLQETARLVEVAGRRAMTCRCDVTQRADIEALVAQTIARFGRFTTMVANAGVAQTVPFLEMTDEDWHRVIDVNLTGVFLCDQIAGQRLTAQGQAGAIINLASQLAEIGWPIGAAYAASKAGVKSLTKSAALALAPHGVRVNAIGPGPVHTPLNDDRYAVPEIKAHAERHIPLGSLGRPQDVAQVACFLASAESKWITGETVFVDGGFLLNSYDDPAMAAARQRAVSDSSSGASPPSQGGSRADC